MGTDRTTGTSVKCPYCETYRERTTNGHFRDVDHNALVIQFICSCGGVFNARCPLDTIEIQKVYK